MKQETNTAKVKHESDSDDVKHDYTFGMGKAKQKGEKGGEGEKGKDGKKKKQKRRSWKIVTKMEISERKKQKSKSKKQREKQKSKAKKQISKEKKQKGHYEYHSDDSVDSDADETESLYSWFSCPTCGRRATAAKKEGRWDYELRDIIYYYDEHYYDEPAQLSLFALTRLIIWKNRFIDQYYAPHGQGYLNALSDFKEKTRIE